jgi:hypothetical protein
MELFDNMITDRQEEAVARTPEIVPSNASRRPHQNINLTDFAWPGII